MQHFGAARQAGCLAPACLPLRALRPLDRPQTKSCKATRTDQEFFITSRRVDSL